MPDARTTNIVSILPAQSEIKAPVRESAELSLFCDLYDVAGMPQSWQRFLTRICDVFGASAGAIARRGTNHDPDRILALYVRDAPLVVEPAEARQARSDYAGRPILPPFASERLLSAPIFSLSIGHLDSECLFRKLGMHHVLVARTIEDRDRIAYITVARAPHQQPFALADEGLIETLLPHFQRALQLASLFEKLKADAKASAAVLDLIPVGVVILDERGGCVMMNEAARKLLDADGAILRHVAINMAKARGTERRADRRAQDPQILSLPSQGGTQALLAIIWDIPDDATDRRHNLAFILNPEQRHSVDIDLKALERLYGLTLTEARVATLLAGSNSVAEIADQLGNTAHTIRTHLRHIFEKTGTDRQVDLVHLLLRSLIALQAPADLNRDRG